MTKLRYLLFLPAFLLISSAFTLTAYAKQDNSGGSSSSGSGNSGSNNNENEVEVHSSIGTETNVNTSTNSRKKADSASNTTAKVEDNAAHRAEIETHQETEANNLLHELKANHKEHTVAERIQNCKAAEKGLETRLSSLGNNATKYKAHIDKVFLLAQNYQKAQNITVPSWDTLAATAQAAQTESALSVAVLKSLSPNLDCSQSTVATNVANFKVAAAQAKTDLKAYKTAVKEVLKPCKQSKRSNHEQ